METKHKMQSGHSSRRDQAWSPNVWVEVTFKGLRELTHHPKKGTFTRRIASYNHPLFIVVGLRVSPFLMVKVYHHSRGITPFSWQWVFAEDRNRFGWTGTTSGRLRSLSPALWSWRRRHVWRQVPRHGFLKRSQPAHVVFFRSDKKAPGCELLVGDSITFWKFSSSEPKIWPSERKEIHDGITHDMRIPKP